MKARRRAAGNPPSIHHLRLTPLIFVALSALVLTGCPEEGDLGYQPYSALVPCDLADLIEADEVQSPDYLVTISCTDEARTFDEPFFVDWTAAERQLGLVNERGTATYSAPICGADGVVLFGVQLDDDPGIDAAFQVLYQALAENLEGQPLSQNGWKCNFSYARPALVVSGPTTAE